MSVRKSSGLTDYFDAIISHSRTCAYVGGKYDNPDTFGLNLALSGGYARKYPDKSDTNGNVGEKPDKSDSIETGVSR